MKMMTYTQAKILTSGLVFTLVLIMSYVVPLTLGAALDASKPDTSNKNNMMTKNYGNLDVTTRNFLTVIEEAQTLLESKNFTPANELAVRARLRAVFGEYFSVLIPTETNFGMKSTERSREVIQISIDEFMELENSHQLLSEIASDLDDYSKIMTEALIYTATSV